MRDFRPTVGARSRTAATSGCDDRSRRPTLTATGTEDERDTVRRGRHDGNSNTMQQTRHCTRGNRQRMGLGAERVREQAERELQRLADAAEYGASAVISVGRDGRVRHWNKGTERLLGYTEGGGAKMREHAPFAHDRSGSRVACGPYHRSSRQRPCSRWMPTGADRADRAGPGRAVAHRLRERTLAFYRHPPPVKRHHSHDVWMAISAPR